MLTVAPSVYWALAYGPSAFLALAPVPLQRDYAGPSGVELVARQTAAPAPAKPPEKKGDLSMDDVFGTGPSAPPATEGTPANAVTGTTGSPAAPAGETKPGDLSMDDVFGGGGGMSGPEQAPAVTPPATATATPTVVKQVDTGAGKKPPSASERISSATNGKLQTRFRIVSSVYYDVDRGEPNNRISRNENRLEFYFAYTPNKHVQIVGDAEPVLMGVSQAQELDDLATQTLLQRFHMESDAAYVALTDLAPGLDIKIGRQIVVWGTADKFNPTNNINPDDLEDRPLFTEPIANQMVVIDYAPLRDRDKLFFQGVYVPLFFPALLPPSAALGLKDPFAEAPFVNQTEIAKLTYLQEQYLPKNPKFIPLVFGNVEMPETTFANGQFAAKIGSRLGEVDLSASYYYGRHDIPLPVEARTTMVAPINEDPPPADGVYFHSNVRLIYPKMQVIGLDFATQVPFLGNMGLWGEAALIIPEAQQFSIDLPPLPGGGVDVTPDDGMANPEAVIQGVSIKKQPFIKATAGFDYTFGKHVYVQAQYLRGMINEFGAGLIGNYLLGGTDLIFFGRKLVFRAFGMVDFPSNNPRDKGPSAVVAPALLFAPPWGYVNFELGSFALIGGDKTYFGQRATGSSILYFKVVGSF